MALKVVEEQAAAVKASTLAGPRRDQSPQISPHGERSAGLSIAVIAAIVASRFALDLAWGAQSVVGSASMGWVEGSLRAGVNSSLVVLAVLWCRGLGGGALAQLATAVGVVSVPGLWLAGWSWSFVALAGLAIALLIPLALSRGRSGLWWISLALVLSVAWWWLASAWQVGFRRAPVVEAGPWFVGPVQLVVVFVGWLILLQATRPRGRRSGDRAEELPSTVRDLGLWIAITSVLLLFALLLKGLALMTVASVWLAVPVGLAAEMLSRKRFGPRWVLVVLAAFTVQLGVIALWLLAP